MDIQLTRKTWCVFGLKGSGKSTLMQYIAAQYGAKCLMFDTLHEVNVEVPFHVYQPKNRQSPMELETVIALLRANKPYRMFVIDEANRFCKPKPSSLPQGVADMNDWARHEQFNLSVGYIARRPVQLNTDLTEIADYLFIFGMAGKNDVKYLNDLRNGLGDTVKDLPLFHYAVVYPDRTWKVATPIPMDKISSDKISVFKGTTQ